MNPQPVDYSKFKVPELKEECRNRGLKVSGTKAELIERLEGKDSPNLKNKRESLEAQPPAVTGWEGISNDDMAAVDMPTLAKEFTQNVQEFHTIVTTNWNNTEEHIDKLMGYFRALDRTCQAIYNISVLRGLGFQHCSEVLVLIGDYTQQLMSIPMRGIEDALNDDVRVRFTLTREGTVNMMEGIPSLFTEMWGMLICSAIVHGCDYSLQVQLMRDLASFDYFEMEYWTEDPVLQRGLPKFRELEKSNVWQHLPSRKKVYTNPNNTNNYFTNDNGIHHNNDVRYAPTQ